MAFLYWPNERRLTMNTMLKNALRKVRGPLNQLETNIICGENGDEVLRELNRFNRREPCWTPPTKSAKALALEAHSIVAIIMACVAMNIATPAVTACNTADCFTDSSIFRRDSDLDHWLTKSLPATEGGETKVMKLVRAGMMFKHMAQAVLNESSDNLRMLGKKFVGASKTYNPKQVEELVLRFHKGDKSVSLLNDGGANLFPIHDDKGEVFVLGVRWYGGRWNVFVRRFAYDSGWSADRRLFLRN